MSDAKTANPSPSLTKPATTASFSSSSASSSSAAASTTDAASTSIAIGPDGFEVLPEPIHNPHIDFKNWLIASACVGGVVLLLLIANSAESIPEASIWLILFGSVWGLMTLCCGMFKAAEKCAMYVREQEMNGYIGTNGEVETTGAAATATDSGAGDAKYQKL